MVDYPRFMWLLEKRIGPQIQCQWDRFVQALQRRDTLWYTVLENKLQVHLFMRRLEELDGVHWDAHRYDSLTKPAGYLLVIRLEYDD